MTQERVAVLLLTLIIGAVGASWLSLHGLHDVDLLQSLLPPHGTYWLGLDEEGRDLFTLLLYGGRVSLGIGLVVVVLTASIGTTIGAMAGYWGGRWDELFIFVTDILLAFPSLLLAIALAAFQTESSIWQVIVVLSAVGWVSYARLVRGQVLALREQEFLQAARLSGCGFGRILGRHLLPNIAGPLLVQSTFGLAGVILAESTLSFLGLGVPPDVPSWGRLLDQGVQYLLIAPHLSIYPGLAIMLSILSLNLLGDGLKERWDHLTTPRH